jgi:hypothetical protein
LLRKLPLSVIGADPELARDPGKLTGLRLQDGALARR